MRDFAFQSRRIVGPAAVFCAAALAVIGVSVATASTASRVASGSTPRCATRGLVVWLDTQGNGAAGSIYYTLELTNLSGHTCTLRGFPGVSAVNLTGKGLGTAAARDHTTTATKVTLAKGQSATAVLRIVQVGVFTPSTCNKVTAAGLRVYPPNQEKSKIIPFPFAACSHKGPVFLDVQVVKKA